MRGSSAFLSGNSSGKLLTESTSVLGATDADEDEDDEDEDDEGVDDEDDCKGKGNSGAERNPPLGG